MKLILDKLHNDHINFIKLLTFLEWLKWTMIEAQSRRDGNFKDCGKVCCAWRIRSSTQTRLILQSCN